MFCLEGDKAESGRDMVSKRSCEIRVGGIAVSHRPWRRVFFLCICLSKLRAWMWIRWSQSGRHNPLLSRRKQSRANQRAAVLGIGCSPDAGESSTAPARALFTDYCCILHASFMQQSGKKRKWVLVRFHLQQLHFRAWRQRSPSRKQDDTTHENLQRREQSMIRKSGILLQTR